MGKKNVEIEDDEVLEVSDSDDDKTFDDIMNEILGEDDSERKTDRDEFEEKISKVSRSLDMGYTPNCVEVFENTQTYKFSDDARIGLFNGFSFDVGVGEGFREKTLLQTSHNLEVSGRFNTRDLTIEKHPESEMFGHVELDEKQKVDSLTVGNVGLFGEFDAAIVSILDSTYVDITLDISDKSKCTYLLVDARFDRVCGKINMTKDFYNQLSRVNLDYLINIDELCDVEIEVEHMPISEYMANKIPSESIGADYSTLEEILYDMGVKG